MGRFISLDPAKDGLNWYAYCNNNPLSNIDLDGQAAMSASNNLINFIAAYESFAAKAYRGADSQNQTIGYGHVILKGEDYSKGIIQEKAKELLKTDLQTRVDAVNNLLGDKTLTQQQFDALVDFAYNCGTGALKSSTLLKDVKGSTGNLRADFDAWSYCNGSLLLGLWRRREDEWDMWENGDYNRNYPNPTPAPSPTPTPSSSVGPSPTNGYRNDYSSI